MFDYDTFLCVIVGGCNNDEFDAGYSTCLPKQTGVNHATCPLSTSRPPPGNRAACIGDGWVWIRVGGKYGVIYEIPPGTEFAQGHSRTS